VVGGDDRVNLRPRKKVQRMFGRIDDLGERKEREEEE
jgi:hypothetical protein